MPEIPSAADVVISPHLQLREVACPCEDCRGLVAPMNVALLRAWAHLRGALDCQIVIHSGYRCLKHNRAVGGSKTSKHMTGIALDIGFKEPVDLLDDALLSILLACGFRGIGRSQNKLHVDVRDRPYFWNYTAAGGTVRDDAAFQHYKKRARP